MNFTWDCSVYIMLSEIARSVSQAHRLSIGYYCGLTQWRVTHGIGKQQHLAWPDKLQLKWFPIEVSSDHADPRTSAQGGSLFGRQHSPLGFIPCTNRGKRSAFSLDARDSQEIYISLGQ